MEDTIGADPGLPRPDPEYPSGPACQITGAKGCMDDAVHEAVIEAGEQESGISIHDVDEQYDHGRIFFQASCQLFAG